MKITRRHLRTIIAEEIEATFADINRKKQDKKRKKRDKERQDRQKKAAYLGDRSPFPGYDDKNGGLKQLAKGIAEEDEGCVGNPYRKADGTWGGRSNARVYTRGYDGDNSNPPECTGKYKTSGGGKGGAAAKPCGRAPDGKKYPYRCRDGKRLWEDEETGDVYVHLDDVIKILQQLYDVEAGHQQTQVVEGNEALAKKCLQMGYTTPQKAFQNLVKTIDTLKRAESGKLYEPQG